MKNYIYILRNPNDGDVVYVGKTKNPKNRKRDHCRKCKGKYRSLLDKWKNQILESGKVICQGKNKLLIALERKGYDWISPDVILTKLSYNTNKIKLNFSKLS